MSKITFDHVYYTYDASSPLPSKAIEDITFTLDGHFFAGIIGHTGSGKSTLVQQINALLRPTSGKVIVNDFEINGGKKKLKDVKTLRKKVGLVFQFAEYQLFEETVLKDVSFGPKNFHLSEEEAINKAKIALQKVGIPEDYYEKSPFELSGGEKRRVALAGMIAIEPEILVLDEPTAGLDPKGAEEILKLFYELYNQGTSIIIITHDMNIILKYVDHVLLMHQGHLKGIYAPYELFYDEELLKENEIDAPELIKVIKMCEDNGLDLERKNIKDISSFIEEIKRVKGL